MMYKLQLLLLFLSSVCSAELLAASNLPELTDLKANQASAVANGINKFSGDFYSVAGRNNANLIYSPFSMSAVFAMLKLGTRGQTSSEIQRVFHYPADDATLLRGFKKIFQSLDALKSSPNFTVTSANRVYVDDKFQILPSYENAIKENFGGEDGGIVKLDLNQPSAASQINAWVEQVTRNKIKNLISPQDLANDPKLVLVNAIYFLGQWEREFEKKDTQQQDFFLSGASNDKIQVDMMHQDITLDIADLPQHNAQAIALPYKGGRFVFLIYLPKTRNGLSTFNAQNLPSPAQVLAGTKKERVHLSLPKFKVESTLDLAQSLSTLGINKIFGNTGDFSGLSADAKLRVSKAIQKAVIIVDEKGTEAAAATGVVVGPTSVQIPPPELKVDHPFYYQLVDKHLNLVLFSGAVKHPQ